MSTFDQKFLKTTQGAEGHVRPEEVVVPLLATPEPLQEDRNLKFEEAHQLLVWRTWLTGNFTETEARGDDLESEGRL